VTSAKCVSIVFLLAALGCDTGRPVNPVIPQNAKPDLRIDSVTYTRLPTCWQGYPSGIICGPPRFNFILTIANIGPADMAEPFYMSNSCSRTDFDSQYCSHTIRVNDPPASIPVGGSIHISYVSFIDDSTSQVLFVINTNDRFDRGVPLPRIDEVSYDNNEYDLVLTW